MATTMTLRLPEELEARIVSAAERAGREMAREPANSASNSKAYSTSYPRLSLEDEAKPMSSDFLAHVAEMLAPLGAVRSTRMFGGIGIYIDGLFCALVMDDSLYFKGDAENIAEFMKAGCVPFTYEKKGELQVIKYYRVPESAMDDAGEMQHWARLGMAAALRKAAGPARKSVTKRSA